MAQEQGPIINEAGTSGENRSIGLIGLIAQEEDDIIAQEVDSIANENCTITQVDDFTAHENSTIAQEDGSIAKEKGFFAQEQYIITRKRYNRAIR